MSSDLQLTRIAAGVYRLVHDGRSETVYMAATASEHWLFWNGQLFTRSREDSAVHPERHATSGRHALTAPMPATIRDVFTVSGATVKKGDTLMLLEAMKMELPVRAPADGTVTHVAGRKGELVAAGTLLVELQQT